MPHTQYFIASRDALSPYGQQGQYYSIPVDPANPVQLIVAYMGELDPTQDQQVDTLPDALRSQVISQEQALALAAHGVLPTDTTFQVVDKLTVYSRDMRFKIK
jgi:hypothetical protein